jgi:hypothetical protein
MPVALPASVNLWVSGSIFFRSFGDLPSPVRSLTSRSVPSTGAVSRFTRVLSDRHTRHMFERTQHKPATREYAVSMESMETASRRRFVKSDILGDQMGPHLPLLPRTCDWRTSNGCDRTYGSSHVGAAVRRLELIPPLSVVRRVTPDNETRTSRAGEQTDTSRGCQFLVDL